MLEGSCIVNVIEAESPLDEIDEGPPFSLPPMATCNTGPTGIKFSLVGFSKFNGTVDKRTRVFLSKTPAESVTLFPSGKEIEPPFLAETIFWIVALVPGGGEAQNGSFCGGGHSGLRCGSVACRFKGTDAPSEPVE